MKFTTIHHHPKIKNWTHLAINIILNPYFAITANGEFCVSTLYYYERLHDELHGYGTFSLHSMLSLRERLSDSVYTSTGWEKKFTYLYILIVVM